MPRVAPRTTAAPVKVRLDDALDYLGSPAGRGLINTVKADLEKQGVKFGEVMGPGMGPSRYQDGFQAEVANFLYGSFLTGAQTTAALPDAVAWALSKAADANGLVSLEHVKKVFGQHGATVVKALATAIGDAPVPTSRRAMKYDHLPDELADLVGKSAVKVDLAPRMPALAELSKQLGGPTALAGMKMIAVQHLFPTTQTLFEELGRNGLDPQSTTLMGKNYSANPDVVYRLRGAGWNVPLMSMQQLLVNNPDGSTRAMNVVPGYLQKMFEGVDPKTAKKPSFLLLDEGGKLISALHEFFPEYAPLCVAVEQTEHGVQVIEDMKKAGIELKCPVVNVARSQTKKQLEAPMIGESVVHSTETAMQQAGVDPEQRPKEACVIGYGAVGHAVADALRRRGYTVFVNDIAPDKMAQALKDGCTPLPRTEALAHGHLMFSCTGRTTITPDEFDSLLPDHAVLVNAASGNQELGMDKIEVGAGFVTDDTHEKIDELGFKLSDFGGREVILGDIAGRDEGSSRILRTKSGHERLVLRSGYVINMTQDIPPEYIQLTRGMLLAACLQASTEKGTGLVDLNAAAQELVVKSTEAGLAKVGGSLQAPDFRTLAPSES